MSEPLTYFFKIETQGGAVGASVSITRTDDDVPVECDFADAAMVELLRGHKHPGIIGTPIPMLLTCPAKGCGERHVDEGEFAIKPHRDHACQFCGHVWRPALINTVGVRFLPGYKDGAG